MTRQAQRVRTKTKISTTKQTEAVKHTTAAATKSTQETSSAQIVDQQQSQELAQTLLHCSISSITYLRNLFPDRCFDEQAYAVSNHFCSYEQYANGSISHDDGFKDTCRVLRKGRHAVADKLLEMLELGIFDALKRKVVRAIQLTISEDPNHPEEVIESWTFSIDYTHPGNGVVLSELSVQSNGNTPITVKRAKHAMQTFQRLLVTLCSGLPTLPDQRYLNVVLYYTEDCNKDYEPPGFKSVEDQRQLWPNDKNWRKETSSCGSSDMGFHSVKLKASYLVPASDTAITDGESMTGAIPSGMKKTRPCLGQDDVQVKLSALSIQEPREFEGSQGEAHDLDETECSLANAMELDLNDDLYTAQTPRKCLNPTTTKRKHLNPTAMKLHHDGSKYSTQRSKLGHEDKDMLLSLQNMLSRTPQPESIEPTQLLESQTTQSHNYRENSELSDSFLKLRLSPRKVVELESRVNAMASAPKKESQPRKNAAEGQSDDIVDCQCGYQEEEDHMIQCHFCRRWQHLPCYGYRSSEDPRIPEVHACYKCLLLDREPDVYRKLEGFVLLRKGAHILLKCGYNSDKQFAEAIHCNVQDAARIQKRLRRQGFVESTPGSHKAGFPQMGKPRFTAVKGGENRAKLYKTYFEPTFEIAHHFALPERQLPDATLNSQFLPLSLGSQQSLSSLRDFKSKFNDKAERPITRTQDPAITPLSMDEEFLQRLPRGNYNLRNISPTPPASCQELQPVVVKSTSKRSRSSLDKGEDEARSEHKRLRSSRSQISLNVALRSPSPMQ